MTIGEDVLYFSVRELGEQIRARKLSPVELTEAYLRRSETLGARLNAYATLTPERALAEARAAEKEIGAGKYRGPLHGIPYAAKDLLAAKGYPTQWGAKPFAKQTFDFDANVIRRLKDAGAVLIGKAAMIELAGGMGYRYGTASISGGTKNPWNETHWTCGSSSGSGAIVSAALAGFAIGSETWGSIVCPSAFCGVSGLRPTFGRVGRSGAMNLSYSMDKIGPMARTAVDCSLVLEAISGHDAADNGSLPEADAKYRDVSTDKWTRVGLVTNAWKTIDPEVQTAIEGASLALALNGGMVRNVELPEGPWEVAAGVTISVEGASAFDQLIESGRVQELVDPGSKVGGYVSMTIPGTDYERAQRIRSILQRKIDALFDKFDVLFTASLPFPATPMTMNLEEAFAISDPLGAIGNLCGLPAVSVPIGPLTSKGLPCGVQFVGRALDDVKVLNAAAQLQIHPYAHERRPPV